MKQKIKTYKEYKQYSINKLLEKNKEFTFDKVDDRIHYIYRITNIQDDNKHYYGSRTSISLDIGIKYFTSSSDSDFKKDFKANPKKYKIKIIKIFNNTKDKEIYESYLHQYFNVKSNSKFYNKVNQTPFGHDTTGMVTCTDNEGNKHFLSTEEFNKRDDLSFHTTNTITCIDEFGNNLRVSKDEFESNKNLKGNTVGMFVAIDNEGNKQHISSNNQRYLNGELIAESKGRTYTKEQKENLKKKRYQKRLLFPEVEKQRKRNEKETKIKNGSVKILGIYDDNDILFDIVFGRLDLYCKDNNMPITTFYNSYKNKNKIEFKATSSGNRTKAIKTGIIKYEGWYVKQFVRIKVT